MAAVQGERAKAQALMAKARQEASAATQRGDSKTAKKSSDLADLIQDVINRGDYEELDANSPRRNR